MMVVLMGSHLVGKLATALAAPTALLLVDQSAVLLEWVKAASSVLPLVANLGATMALLLESR